MMTMSMNFTARSPTPPESGGHVATRFVISSPLLLSIQVLRKPLRLSLYWTRDEIREIERACFYNGSLVVHSGVGFWVWDDDHDHELDREVGHGDVAPNTRRVLQLRAVPIGTVLNLRTTTSQKCEAVPRRARI